MMSNVKSRMSNVGGVFVMRLMILVAVLVLGGGEAWGAGVVAPPVKKAGPPRVGVGRRPVNRHLKLPTPAPVKPAAKAKTAVRRVTVRRATSAKPARARHVHTRVTHRASGAVVGIVRDAKGGYVSGATVRLAKAKGRPIRNARLRHTTKTDAAGTYSMRAVRAGRYRVVASKSGMGKGQHALSIHSSGTHHVDVKLGGGKRKRK